MRIGITGSPQSGKTSIFKILLGNLDISSSIGVFRPTDKRIERLVEIYNSKKKTYPELTFIEVGSAGNLTKKDLSNLGDLDLFICVVGSFFSQDPKKDFDSILTDLILHDLEVIQNRLARLEKERSRVNADKEKALLEKYQSCLSDGDLISSAASSDTEPTLLSGLSFLTSIPIILAINSQEEELDILDERLKPLKELSSSKNIPCVIFFGKEELDLLGIEEKERARFLKDLGNSYNFREDISRLIFEKMDLVTFFTAGEKEVRGWHLRKGLPIIEAAGKIHSDIKRGFIRAEVISFDDFVAHGSMHAAKEKGVLRLEGKEYIVKDGDIIDIRFNV
ncbi:MAG: DUF933 domain-containing protein [Candidatus Omnitrophota bacterium]